MITQPVAHRLRNRDMTAAWRHVDWVLVALVSLLSIFGALMVYSATKNKADPYGFISKHAMFVAIGVVVMAAVAALDYQKLRDWAMPIYLLCIAGLGGVLVFGSVHANIKAWYDIGPFQIQPSEFAKVATIVTVASYLGSIHDGIRLRHVVVSLVMLLLPVGLIMLQPDLGTALVFLVVAVGLLVVSGTPMRYLLVLVLLAVGGVVGILGSNTLDSYQKDRLTSFVNPDAASQKVIYNTKQAQTAIANGGVSGKGLFEGPFTKSGSVPAQQTDFIFTVPAEELGFLGSATLLLLEAGIVFRIWRTAQLARDEVGRLMCVGVLAMLVFHVFENAGMNLGIMPVTGIPLPFVSYGGSAIIASFAAIGLVLNVHMRRFA